MYVASAIDLINKGLIYKPGWTFEASDHTNRFEGHVLVKVRYHAHNSNRDCATRGYDEQIETYASFTFSVVNCTEHDVIFQMLLAIIEIEIHEAREFLRDATSFESYFHPHRVAEMARWRAHATPCRFGPMLQRDDVQFGIA